MQKRSLRFGKVHDQTDSLKIHIDIVRHGETQDVIKILKLWRHRHDIPLGLVVIELATGQALFSNRQNSLEDRVWNPV